MFPVPFNDRQRLQALASYGVLDTASEDAFDALTRIACRTFAVPIALVSLVDSDRQWFKARTGLNASETAREVAFCAHAIVADHTLVVRDAIEDPRFRTNPLVTGAPNVRFYAGAALVTAEGFRLGTFCIIDHAPRPEFCEADIATLEDFARTTMRLLEMRRANQASNAMSHEATAAEDARKDVFALVAHEIRSPIATMIGVTRAIEGRTFGPLSDPRYAVFLTALNETAEQIGEVTDRMLNFARFGSGEIELKEETVGVDRLLDAAVRAAAGVVTPKKIILEVRQAEEGLTLNLDPTLANQMLTNLIANAAKVSPSGGRISLTALSTESGSVAIMVSDNGPGISDTAIAEVSEGRNSVGLPACNTSGGTGLGLPLVRRLVELHGGRLTLKRRMPSGTVATLQFPPYRRFEANSPAARSA